MAEGPSSHHHHHHQPLIVRQTQHRSRGGGLRTTPGEIVEVQGGHIVRSTGRKDRHSKVCTAKGPRDRRVRLSAHTAIQFYDVQDRLGYDRPSKAVDWLIKNAKAAIDELAELPAWHPTAVAPSANSLATNPAADTNPATAPMNQESSDMQIHYEFSGGGGGSSFLPPSLDSDAIADTIKSFFPMAAAAAAGGGGGDSAGTADPSSSSPIGFQSYPPDLLSRTSSSGQNQDLRLSLQSFQDLHFHHQQHQHHHHHQQQQQNQWSDSAAAVPWAWAMAESSSGNAGGYVFGVQQQQQQQAMAMQQQAAALGQSQFFTQRGPLQSSNQPFARAWADPMAAADQHHHHLMHSATHHHSAAHSIGFASGGSSGFSGFRIPARIQGEEEHDGISDKPSSASSGSHH